jgi:exodeoxyribonuclease V alpha subunit
MLTGRYNASVETVTGVIERVAFHNAENGFAVLRVVPREGKDLITVVGHVPQITEGELIEATGEWVENRTHGTQFKAEQLRVLPPQSREGIERYLASGLIKGIGAHTAKQIVLAFGERTLTILDEQPEELRKVKGIGKRRLEQILASWREQRAVRHIVIFFQDLGVPAVRAMRIYRTYGPQTLDIVRANPYQLANDVPGFGFPTADALAQRLGISRASPMRAQAALRHVLQELSAQGHCGFPEGGAVARTATLTGIDYETVADAVELGRQKGELVRETGGEEPWLYFKPLYVAEVGVAQALKTLREGRHPLPPLDVERALHWVEDKMGLQLSHSQAEAIRQALTQKVLVITGGPGVGKTTLVRGLLEIAALKNLRCALCAPTGRAAKRLSETTGREARTIHRLLEFDPLQGGFNRHRRNPLEVDLLIVDETSMVDIPLMNHLLAAVPQAACLVLVGDVDQLPSVGPGTVLADIIRSAAVAVARLTHVFRQAEHSWIVRAAHSVNGGEQPLSAPPHSTHSAEGEGKGEGGDFYFVEAQTPEIILARILTMVRERIPARFGLDPLRDIQILTPMNRNDLGTIALNSRLQEALNPRNSKPQIERLNGTFRVGDKVIQTVNNYQKDVFNGDVGRISYIDVEEQEVVVDYDSGPLKYDFPELEELALAYALTVHKSQGSEYPAVIVPLHMQHSILLQRNLLYTAITRGKKLVVLVGQRQALARAVSRQDTTRRYSALCRRLRESS